MKKLKLSDDKALEIYKTADANLKQILEETWGKDFFKPKLITDIVHDISSLCAYLKINESELYIFPKDSVNKHYRYINACNILPKIVEIYNEGKILNWNDSSEYKYLPYLYFSGGSGSVSFGDWCYRFKAGGSVYYKSELLAKSSYNNFSQIWKDYWQQEF